MSDRPVALSAPGLIGPNSILNPPWSGPRASRRRLGRPYSHVRLEVDLTSDVVPTLGTPLWKRIEAFLSAPETVEATNLVRLSAATLHALASCGFRRVDHWEVAPGGWLPPPAVTRSRQDEPEPVGQLLAAIQDEGAPSISGARSFAVRISDLDGNRADIVVRRVHRRRRHSLTLDLWGSWTRESLGRLTGALAQRLPVAQVDLTRYRYGAPNSRGQDR